MDDNVGLVISIQGEDAIVQMKRTSACSQCGACAPSFADPNGQEIQIEVKNTINAVPGDKVRITMEPGIYLYALGILYGIPFVFMLTGFFGGTFLGNLFNFGDFSALVGFFSGVALAYLSLRIIKAKGLGEEKARHRVEMFLKL